MKKWLALVFALAAAGAVGEELGDRVTVPFSDPSRHGSVRVSLIVGGVSVKGYAGKEVIVEAHGRHDGGRREREKERADGLHRIEIGTTGLNVEESDNVVQVSTRSYASPVDLTIQVPFETALKLTAINDGDISVDHVAGELDINNTNGSVKLINISGSAVAHALNGNVFATLDKVTPGKAMSFSSLNGEINVTLPPDLKARGKLKSDNAEAYTAFDIKLHEASRKPVVEGNRADMGKN